MDGALGTVLPQGEILVHFYYEYPSLPVEIEIEQDMTEMYRDSHLTRNVHSSFFLTPDIARKLGNYLVQLADSVSPESKNLDNSDAEY